jgi:anti-anti-sigma regulatory factor
MAATPMFDCARDGDVLVITVRDAAGAFDVDRTAETDAILLELREPATAGAVIDLAALPWFGSMLLESLRILWTQLRPNGQKMALCGVGDVGKEILRLARFDTLWPICATREEALKLVRG